MKAAKREFDNRAKADGEQRGALEAAFVKAGIHEDRVISVQQQVLGHEARLVTGRVRA